MSKQTGGLTFANAEHLLRADILNRISDYAANRPRALQTEVGCSSLGTVCDRKLGYMLLQSPRLRVGESSGWMANIGTAVHAWLEQVFSNSDEYMTETPITVKHSNLTIPGTVDLYAKKERTVIDFKVVGSATLYAAKLGRISRQYSIQVQLYGLGLQQAGHKVENVGILFLPRNGELRDAILWETRFDPQMAKLAIDRYRNIQISIQTAGDDALELLAVDDGPCTWCDYFNPAAKELAQGCPGRPLTTIATSIV